MQFQVPQFIETEDKIIGPLTLRQFLYVAAGAGIAFVLFFFLQTWLWIIITMVISSVSVAFAFVKINGRPLSALAGSAFGFYWKPRFYLWEKEQPSAPEEKRFKLPTLPQEPKKETAPREEKSGIRKLSQQLLTAKEPIHKREKFLKPPILERIHSNRERFEVMKKITGEKEVARRVDYR